MHMKQTTATKHAGGYNAICYTCQNIITVRKDGKLQKHSEVPGRECAASLEPITPNPYDSHRNHKKRPKAIIIRACKPNEGKLLLGSTASTGAAATSNRVAIVVNQEDKVEHLNPDTDMAIQSLDEHIYSIVCERVEAHGITVAAVVGTLECLKYRLLREVEEGVWE